MPTKDLMVKDAAKKLGRSYSWVYEHLPRMGNEGCYRKGGVIFINPCGLQKLAEMKAEATRPGRPRRRRAGVGGGWAGEP